MFEPDCDRMWAAHEIHRLLHGQVEMTHPCLPVIIRNRFLMAPSKLGYNLTTVDDKEKHPPPGAPGAHPQQKPRHFSKFREDEIVDELLKQKKNGFFVECGAGDGEHFSNSLFLERDRDWQGLLIEANPHFYDHLIAKQRRSYHINACASPGVRPDELSFASPPDGSNGGLTSWFDVYQKESLENTFVHQRFKVQCFPLYTMLKSLDRTRVDYLSLEVSGAELPVLKSIPMEDLLIHIISVKFAIHDAEGHLDQELSQRKLGQFRAQLVWGSGLYTEERLVPKANPEIAIFRRVKW